MRIAYAIVGSTCLALWISAAALGQQKPPTAPAPGKGHAAGLGATPEDLLWRSYVGGRSLPLEERCSLLLSLAQASAPMHSPRARALSKSWSRELFRRASDLPPSWNRTAFLKNSLETLSATDPGGAFDLLPRLDAPEGGDVGSLPEDLRAFAARTVFPRLLDVRGVAALGAIRLEARRIGSTGEYPYAAMGIISKRLGERKHADEVQSIFREALEFYGKGPRVRSSNEEFISYLEGDWPYLPSPLQDEALRVVVAHLTRREEPDPRFSHITRIATDRGTISFHDNRTALLYSVLPKVRQLDPDWASRLEDEYPDLKQPAVGGGEQYSSNMMVVNTTGAPSDQVAAVLSNLQQWAVLSQLRQEATSDPQQAANLLSSLSNPGLRSQALASLATGFATKDPGRAADLLTGAQKAADALPAQMSKLRALTALAEAAVALRDLPRAEQAMDEAFDLGEELLGEELDVHPGETVYSSEALDELSKDARLGAKIAFPYTAARLDHVKNEVLQAYLLIAAAEGLQEGAASPASRPK